MLAELQRALARAFAEPSASAAVLPALRALPRVGAEATLAVYHGSIEAARDEALAELYPVCAALVGEGCMRAIGDALDARSVSRHADLARIGEPLPELIEGLDFLAGVPYLADVARLERAWQRAFVAHQPAADADAQAIARALSEDPHGWRFVLPASAALLSSPHPVLAIWAAHQPGAEPDALARIDLAAGGDRLIVWRRGQDVCIHALDGAVWGLLVEAERGTSVGAWLSDTPADAPEVSRTLRGESNVADTGIETEYKLDAVRMALERGWVCGAEPLAGQ